MKGIPHFRARVLASVVSFIEELSLIEIFGKRGMNL
jgi:hypothetical protein